jgi:hypothetical protein
VGATVSYYPLYDACITKTRLQPVTYTQPAATVATIAAPALDTATALEFYTNAGTPVPSGVGCADYWTTVPPCSAFVAPRPHLTECDPAAVRATIAVATKATTPNKASTTTKVIARRGNE